MSRTVDNKALIERYSRFVEEGKQKTGNSEAFKRRLEKLAEMASREESATPEKKSEPRAGRRHQPPAPGLNDIIASQHSKPTFAKAAKITSVHAERLTRLAPLIEGAARRHNVPVELICGVILQESGGNARAVSPAGARGLMQLMPQTARRFGVKDVFDPAQNIDGGTKYLRWLLDRFEGRVDLALAGYNAGEHNVEKHGNKIPPFKETQQYVPNVLAYTQAMIDILSLKIAQTLPTYARKA